MNYSSDDDWLNGNWDNALECPFCKGTDMHADIKSNLGICKNCLSTQNLDKLEDIYYAEEMSGGPSPKVWNKSTDFQKIIELTNKINN